MYDDEKPSLDELTHFGIKGMKWGVRKKEDSGSGRSIAKDDRVERKAKAFEAEADGIQKRIDNLYKTPARDAYQQQARDQQAQALREYKARATRDAEAVRTGKLTDHQKKVLIGIGATAGVLAIVSAYTLVEHGEANRLMIKGREAFSGKTFEWAKNPELARKDLSIDQIKSMVVDKINPGYGAPGTKMNCRRCTFTYEMRRRGMDVAATKSSFGAGQTPAGVYNALLEDPTNRVGTSRFGMAKSLISEAIAESKDASAGSPFSDALKKIHPTGTFEFTNPRGDGFGKEIMRQLAYQPDGSRGEVGMMWRTGGGHSVAYEIIQGKPVVIDNQSGKIYKTAEELESLGKNMAKAGFTRLDNVSLNDDFLMRWMKNA